MTTPAKIFDQNLPVVALVGRVNVGKSTLFNRIIEQDLAIVSPIPGTTRTRNVGIATWRGKQFCVVDTGGLTFSEAVPLEDEIIHQTELALKEADLIIFVTDVKEGILPQEKELARRLQKIQKTKPIILAANKADNTRDGANAYSPEWSRLGLGEAFIISAQNGVGVGDLLDVVYKKLGKTKRKPKTIELIDPIKVAIVGKPNVGKSSLFNKLIGEERVVVSDMPHTTREPHDTLVEVDKNYVLFIDTAGIRRKTKVSGALERLGVGKSIETLKRADIILFLLDTAEAITDQDQQLAGLLRANAKSVILIVNKWDLAEEDGDDFRNEVKRDIYKQLPHLDYAPIVFVSAKSGWHIHQIFPLIFRANKERATFIPEEELHKFIKNVTRKHLPTRGKGTRPPDIVRLVQINSAPPIFEMFIKYKTSLHISYVHYIENKLRETFGFYATPLISKLTKMKRN